MADILLVDGTGILHPRRAGIAAHLGVLLDRPTIGLTKKQLCGTFDRNELEVNRRAPIFDRGELIGMALLLERNSARPLFISPGHRIDVPTAAAIVEKLCGKRHLPEPIYWADRSSRAEANRNKR